MGMCWEAEKISETKRSYRGKVVGWGVIECWRTGKVIGKCETYQGERKRVIQSHQLLGGYWLLSWSIGPSKTNIYGIWEGTCSDLHESGLVFV